MTTTTTDSSIITNSTSDNPIISNSTNNNMTMSNSTMDNLTSGNLTISNSTSYNLPTGNSTYMIDLGMLTEFAYTEAGSCPNRSYMKIMTTSGEVRPRNQAIRIWKRVKKDKCFKILII